MNTMMMSGHRIKHLITKGGAMLLAIIMLLSITAPGLRSLADNEETQPGDVIIAPEPPSEPPSEPSPEPPPEPSPEPQPYEPGTNNNEETTTEQEATEQDTDITQDPTNNEYSTNDTEDPTDDEDPTDSEDPEESDENTTDEQEPLQRYYVYEGDELISDPALHFLQDAVDACGTDGTWTIIVAQDDDNITGSGEQPVVIPAGVTITLTSDGDRRTLTQAIPDMRHIIVYGTLNLENIILDGEKTGGGLDVRSLTEPFDQLGTLNINEGAVVQNCFTSENGGGISLNGNLTLNGGTITGNIAGNDAFVSGGGVWVNQGTFVMTDGEISNNKAVSSTGSSFGGGVSVSNGELMDGLFTMFDGTVSDNEADYGGGISSTTGGGNTVNKVEISGGRIENNKAGIRGGGVMLGTSTELVINGHTTIYANEAPNGGGVYAALGTVTMTGGWINGNNAEYGAGLYLRSGSVSMNGGNIYGNKASAFGGGVFIDDATLDMKRGIISYNEALLNGGGVYVSGTGTFMMGVDSDQSTEVIGNKAGMNGGGIWTPSYYNLQIASNAIFSHGSQGANKAATSSDKYMNEDAYKEVAQDPFEAPTGVYSPWGQLYSTEANHPLNNYDINVIGSDHGRYLVYDDSGNFIDSYHWLDDAVQACADDPVDPWTIKATEDDDLSTWLEPIEEKNIIKIPKGKNIILTSLTSNPGDKPWTISQPIINNISGTTNISRHFLVVGTLLLENIILDGKKTAGGVLVGSSPDDMGVITGTLIINPGASIQNCVAYEGNFGAVNMNGGEVIMNGGKITENESYVLGGGLYITAGSFTMNGGEITNNVATGSKIQNAGGGIFLGGTSTIGIIAEINGGVISGNKAIGTSIDLGGGIAVEDNASVWMYGGLIKDNVASDRGGGVFTVRSEFNLIGGIIEGNTAKNGAGVEVSSPSNFTMSGGSITGNTAGLYGGGIAVKTNELALGTATLTMTGGTITGNFAGERGAGVHVNSGSIFTMSGGSIESNGVKVENNAKTLTTKNGGGVFALSSTITMTGGHIRDNESVYSGGGVYLITGSTVTMSGGTISGNISSASGGGMYCHGSTIVMTGGSITGNKAHSGGGVNLSAKSKFTMTSGVINKNIASANGGGVCVEIETTFTMGGDPNVKSPPEISANEANSGGGIHSARYFNLRIASNAKFGNINNGVGTHNKCYTSNNYYLHETDFIYAFQTRFADLEPYGEVGIYTPWGLQYSLNGAYHPVNGRDITVVRSYVKAHLLDENGNKIVIMKGTVNESSDWTFTTGVGSTLRLEEEDISDLISSLKKYKLINWALGTPENKQNNTKIEVSGVEDTVNIYLIYQTISSLTVSNEVDGLYALKNKFFDYTVYFMDKDGKPLESKMFTTVTTTPGQTPEETSVNMTTNQDGLVTFKLKHNQKIEIQGVSLDYKFRIEQKQADGYEVWFTDSIAPGDKVKNNDTGIDSSNPVMRPMSMSRMISFKNKMRDEPETGIDSGAIDLFGLSILTGTGGLACIMQAQMIRKLKRRLVWKRLIEHYEEKKE